MEMIKYEKELPKQMYEVSFALASIVKAIRVALKDGWQPGEDIPAIVLSAVQSMPVAIDGIDKIDDEAKALPVSFVQSIINPLADEVELLLKEKK